MTNSTIPSPWKEAQDIVENIQLPVIPERQFCMEAVSGSEIRSILQDLLDKCSASGGGKVIVPCGVYRCDGPLHLRSFTELHFEDGAEIRFSPDPELYLPQVFTRWEGVEIYNYSPAIYGKDLTDVVVSGNGIIRGGEQLFVQWRALQKAAQERSRAMAEQGIPVEERIFEEKDHLRPSLVQLVSCERVLFESITLMEAPFWMFHPLYCRDVIFRNISCNSMNINNDGIDVDSCENVLVEDSVFRNGDDAIVIKSGRDQDGWRVGRPTKNVVIRNCHIPEALHGVAIGSELSGGAEKIYIHDISMGKITCQAIQFKSNRDRGGVIRDVKVRNLSVEQVDGNLIYFCSSYPGDRGGNSPTEFRDFDLENIRCTNANNVFYLQGTPEIPLNNIQIRDVFVTQYKTNCSCREYEGNTNPECCKSI